MLSSHYAYTSRLVEAQIPVYGKIKAFCVRAPYCKAVFNETTDGLIPEDRQRHSTGKFIASLGIVAAGYTRLLQRILNMTRRCKCGPQTLIFIQSQMFVGSHSRVQLLLISCQISSICVSGARCMCVLIYFRLVTSVIRIWPAEQLVLAHPRNSLSKS